MPADRGKECPHVNVHTKITCFAEAGRCLNETETWEHYFSVKILSEKRKSLFLSETVDRQKPPLKTQATHKTQARHKAGQNWEREIMSDVTGREVKPKKQFNLTQTENYFWYFPLKQRDTLKKFIRCCIAHFNWLNSLLDAVNKCKENDELEPQHWQKPSGKENPQLLGHIAGQLSRLLPSYTTAQMHTTTSRLQSRNCVVLFRDHQEVICIMPGSEGVSLWVM